MSTSEDAKKSVSQASSKKEESKNLSTKKDNILYNPELLSKRKVIINTSTSKEMYSFSTAKRFQKSIRDDSPFFYNIPTSISHRGTSIGYGSKISFSSKNQSPGPGAYNYLKINLKGRYAKSDFPNSPQSKFGSSIRFKKEKVFSDTPAPNTYYLESMIKGNGIIYNSRYNSNHGKTMGQKLGTIGQSIVSPGPGSYDYMKLNLKGKYPSSLISNSVLNTFGNEIRFKKKKNEDKLKDSRNKKVFVLEKSTKVIFDKFVNEYDKIVKDLFGDKNDDDHKIQNYEINIEEYKILLVNLGFMKNEIGENENNDLLIKNSFNNYLNPKEGKIETNKFLVFSLAALGIYKGRDEKIIEHCSNITPKFKPEEEKENEENNNNEENQNPKVSNININNNPPKKQIKTSSDFIKLNLPNFNLDKYSYTEKECNTIKSEFFPFVLRINEVWSKGLAKKKQERLDKLEDATKKINLEETKKLENKSKKEEIIDSFRKKLFSHEPRNSNTGNNSPLKKTFRVEDMYEILQKKKQRELDTLKAKKEEDINKECTFQPNAQTKKSFHKKEIEKNIEKLYTEGKKAFIKKRQLEDDNLKKLEKECTFQPVIKDYKGNYFENNPLKEDKLVNTEIKKMEKLREQQGYSNKVIKKQMAFDIEPKTNKDNINKRVAQKRGEKIVSKVKNEFINYGSFDDKGKQIRIKLEINLENNGKETLVIQPQDDFIKVVDDFCAKFGLNDDKKIRLIRTIKDKMRKNEC